MELALFDSAGQEEYDQLRVLMYSDADVVIICFSIDAPDSLANVTDKWAPEVQHYCPGVPIVLCGNKKDLRNNERIIKELEETKQKPVCLEEGIVTAQKIGATNYIECSALTKAGVMDLFKTSAQSSLRRRNGKLMAGKARRAKCRIL